MRRASGFTLIELLVVMAILSILAALLLPAIQIAKEKARGNVCLRHMRQISFAINMYANDYDDRLPHTGRMGRSPQTDEGGYVYGGNYVSFPQNPEACQRIRVEDGVIWTYIDPGKERFRKMPDEWYRNSQKNIYLCPSASPPGKARGFSYPMNCRLEENEAGGYVGQGVKLSMIKNPSDTIMLVDEDGSTLNDGHFMPHSNFDVLTPNHTGGGNLTFCDFHAEWMQKKELDKYLNRPDYFYWWR
jgi:prepilin-type N-terminal cleavage/methylation domain-containing protein/prepilin-type processing-associated H-X9-DG protein